jgi:putative tricarboxylic transport membrane protein
MRVRRFRFGGNPALRGKTMDRQEWTSLVWLGVAVFICIGALMLSLGSFHNPGPGFFPFWAGAIMAISAGIVYFQSRRTSSAQKIKKPLWPNRDRVLKMVFAALALFVYAVTMEYLGFLISTAIFLVFLLRAIEPQRWSSVIFEALIASGISYLIFEIWLKAQLPKGILQI